MLGFLREHSGSMVFSLLLHGGLAAALIFATQFSFQPRTPPPQPLAITAVVINSQVLHAAAQVQAAAKKYVDLNHLQWICVGDRKQIEASLKPYGPLTIVDVKGNPEN